MDILNARLAAPTFDPVNYDEAGNYVVFSPFFRLLHFSILGTKPETECVNVQ